MSLKLHLLTSTTSPELKDWIYNLREFELDNVFDTRILGRAYEYIKGIEIVEIRESKIIAKSIGSAEYKLEIRLEDSVIHGSCSCPYHGPCKHLAALLLSRLTLRP